MSEAKIKDLPKGYRIILIEKQGSNFGRERFTMFKNQPDPVMLRHPRDQARYIMDMPITNGEKTS